MNDFWLFFRCLHSFMPISHEMNTEGGNLTLSCQATGIPPPTVFWIKTSNRLYNGLHKVQFCRTVSTL